MVIANGQVVGRISLFSSSPAGTPWMSALASVGASGDLWRPRLTSPPGFSLAAVVRRSNPGCTFD